MARTLLAFISLSAFAIANAATYPIPSLTLTGDSACADLVTPMLEQQRRINELGQQNAQIQLMQAQTRMVQMYVACRQAGGGQACGDAPQIFVSQQGVRMTTDYDCVEQQMRQPVTGWPKPTDGQRLAAALNYCTR